MVQSFTTGLANLSSYIWGANTSQNVTAGDTNSEPAPILTEEVKASDIVKEGFLYKQSRHLKQWKR